MSDHVQPPAGEEQEVSSSGLLLSVEPLAGATNYKLSGDDGGDDSGGVSGSDDSSDTSDTDSSDDGGGDDSSDDSGSDADGTDAADADGTDTGADADGTDPLGIASDAGSPASGISGQRVKNGDDKDTRDT